MQKGQASKPSARGVQTEESTGTTHASVSKSTAKDSFTIATIAEKAAAILEARGLDLELLARLGWRSSTNPINGSLTIDIPYLKNGVEVNVKTRTISGDKGFRQIEGAEKCFYNYDAITEWQSGHDRLVITEGEMDAVSAIQCGLLAVSVPDGAPAKPINGESLKYSYLDDFPTTGEIILATDSDGPGINLMNDLALHFGWVRYHLHVDVILAPEFL